MTFIRRTTILSVLLVAAVALCACERTPEWPAQTRWRSYTHPRLGYTVDIPDACRAEELGESVLFRYHGDPILCVNYVTPDQGRRRGLWVGKESSGEAVVGGRTWTKYVYEHGDGPLWMNVVSYVIPYRGHELGVEFRMHGTDPGELQTHILDSFTLPE